MERKSLNDRSIAGYGKVTGLSRTRQRVGTQVLVQTYTYDSLGDRAPGAAAATNRSTSMTYDDGGNALTHGAFLYTWDGLNTMVTLSGSGKNERYMYTADDERIGSWDGNLLKWTWRFRDLGATVIREFTSTGGTYHSTTWTWQKDHIHRNGALLASVTPTATRHFHLDHLGTPRLITDAAKAGEAHSYYPFGQEATFVAFDGERMKFTGHERDDRPPSGTQYNDYLDYMHARYYNPVLGRFLSVDPIFGSPYTPQSWNRYSYVINNPVKLVDPTGLAPIYSESITVTASAGDCWSADGCWRGVSWREYWNLLFGPVKQTLDVSTARAYYDSLSRDYAAQGNLLGSFGAEVLYGIVPESESELITTIALSAIPIGRLAGAAKGILQFTPDQQALIALAKNAQRFGITRSEAGQLIKWAREYGVKYQNHISTRHWIGGPHIRIGPINHIPVKN